MFGQIRWFNAELGYGFICPDGETDDLFVHRSGWRDGVPMHLRPQELAGRRVEFDLEEGPKGVQCCDVTLVDENESVA